jgi:hypothetical protein
MVDCGNKPIHVISPISNMVQGAQLKELEKEEEEEEELEPFTHSVG